MNPIPELSPQLKQLRLSGILDSLDLRNRQAIDGKLAYTDFLSLLIADEVARREQKKLTTRLRRANFRGDPPSRASLRISLYASFQHLLCAYFAQFQRLHFRPF